MSHHTHIVTILTTSNSNGTLMRITMCFVKSTLHLDVTSCLLYLYIKTIMTYNLTFFSRYMNTRRLMNYVNVPNYFTSFPFSMHNLEKIFLWISRLNIWWIPWKKSLASRIFQNISFCLSEIMHCKQSWISNFYYLFCLVQFC